MTRIVIAGFSCRYHCTIAQFPASSVLQPFPSGSSISVPGPLPSSFRRLIADISPQDFVRMKPLQHLRETLKIIGLAKDEPIHSVANHVGGAGVHGSNDGK